VLCYDMPSIFRIENGGKACISKLNRHSPRFEK